MKRLENRLPPPLVVTGIAGVMRVAASLVEPLPLELGVRAALGVSLVALGASFVVRGFRAFRAARTTIDPVHIDRAAALVTDGVYRRTRNPMYVGFATMLVGWAAFLSVPWLLLGPAFFVLFTTYLQIVPEERAMRARFGAAYDAYVSRSPRWL